MYMLYYSEPNFHSPFKYLFGRPLFTESPLLGGIPQLSTNKIAKLCMSVDEYFGDLLVEYYLELYCITSSVSFIIFRETEKSNIYQNARLHTV